MKTIGAALGGFCLGAVLGIVGFSPVLIRYKIAFQHKGWK